MKLINQLINTCILSSCLIMGLSSVTLGQSTCSIDRYMSASEKANIEVKQLVEYTNEQVNTLLEQGKYTESTTLRQQVSVIQSYSSSDIDESRLPFYLQEIAKVYQSQGNYSKAEALYLQSLSYLRRSLAKALEQINNAAAEGEQQIQGFLAQLNAIAKNPQQLDQQIAARQQVINMGQFQGQKLTSQQMEELKRETEQLRGLRDLAKQPAEFQKRVQQIKQQLETQLADRKREAEANANNLAKNLIAEILNNLAILYQLEQKETIARFFIEQTSKLLKQESLNSDLFTDIANFYSSIGKDQQAKCMNQ